MEKRTPHAKLSQVKWLVKSGKTRMTTSAYAGARLMGFDRNDVMNVVLKLTAKDFYKSMTTLADHAIWQDVYRPRTTAGGVYLKLTVIDELLVVSFKEL